MTKSKKLSPRQAKVVAELARTPGGRVPWYVLADAIGEPVDKVGRLRVYSVVQRIRLKFGRDAILADYDRGYYVKPGF